jgi:hypothetical protein
MALDVVWITPKEFTAETGTSSDMNNYVSQLLLYLYTLLDHFGSIVCYEDEVVCYEDEVVYYADLE